MRIAASPAMVLHHRPYGETSLLVELFSRDHGRIGLVARGARSARATRRALLGPFQPLLASWSARGEMGTLGALESGGAAFELAGESLYCGFYINELMVRLLHRHDAHPSLYDHYQEALDGLCSTQHDQRAAVLRLFEARLLQHLGFGLVLDVDVQSGEALEPEVDYDYVPDEGPRRLQSGATPRGIRLRGHSLLALAHGTLGEAAVLQDLKRLLRSVIALHTGNAPLHSRKLFRAIANPHHNFHKG